MESVISHVYILPRQLFGPDRLAGPAGLARYLGRPCGEDGCYAISFRGDSIYGAVVYGTTQAYDCFVRSVSGLNLAHYRPFEAFRRWRRRIFLSDGPWMYLFGTS